jgi:FKBP-type peptidyl-prolyl cis-trans isomerase SlyD
MTIEKIENGVVVSLAYTLTVDGEVVDHAETEEPLEYLHGAENIVPGLETALIGKRVGDKVNVTLTPDEAYGDYDEDEVEEVDKADIDQADQLQAGMLIEAEDDEGYVSFGLVREITGDTIILDFNPPLAGKTLTYDVQVVNLREADQEELAHGHPHSLHSHYQHVGDDFDYEDDDDDYYDDDDNDYEDNGYYDDEDDDA